MIHCCFWRHQGQPEGFEIRGHAGYAPAGQDLVCAAISTLAQSTIRSVLELLDLEIEYQLDSVDGLISLKLLERPAEQRLLEDYHLLIKSCLIGVQMAQEAYPEYLEWELREQSQ